MMKKTMKIILILSAIITIFIGGAIVLFVAKIDQSTIKSELVQLVHNKIGSELTINGDVQWSFFPWFGIKLHDAVLEDVAGSHKNELAKAGEVGFSVKLLPLFSGRITVGHLILKDFSLQLTAIDLLKHNWQKLATSKSASNSNIANQKSLADKSFFNLANLTVADVSIENGRVFWQNQQINKLDLYCKNINFDRPFEVETNFYLQNPNSILNGQIKANACIKLDVDNKLYTLTNLQLVGKSADKVDFGGVANVAVDLNKQTLISENFKLHIADTVAMGSLRCNNIIDAPNFVVDLKVAALQIKKLKLDNFSAKIIGNKELINCPKIGFGFHHGNVSGSATIDLRSAVPQLGLKLVFNNVAMRSLLVDIAKYDEFSGTLTLNTNINMRGKTDEEMLHSINGSGNVLIANGSYRGIDIPFEVRRASSILNQKAMPQESQPPHTDFDRLTATFNVGNALLSTSDLLIQSPDFRVTGKGSANIVSEQLELQLNAYSTHDKNFFVPIKVSGSFTKPSIKPDVAVIAGQIVVKEIGKQLQRLNIPQDLLNVLPLDKLLH
ncbi:AsmA protein [Gammaproteobacteria bacterium]